MILCDTNILIEISKGNSQIIHEVQQIGIQNIAISAVTAAEFMYGALNKQEMAKIKKALRQIHIIQMNEKISAKMIELVESYALSHTLAVPDAIIAATAIIEDTPLYTLNLKDFRFIPELELYQP
ncbi:type II toxin-antitoxin system VapC family toxin [Chondrinema litorale]|uniref:type II toxin-antitoxin system VapC family toxin n=1 Tax=Chondrinema litorale TaxID=2994555 RepID=UPI002543AD53|nr:type II toxin-antitoxin system VapC family toxin [Chondrinema litorale]UZR98933.1 type II toxin-antitoxin system VapC family toxin [Chondrinema litorale]